MKLIKDTFIHSGFEIDKIFISEKLFFHTRHRFVKYNIHYPPGQITYHKTSFLKLKKFYRFLENTLDRTDIIDF